MASRHHWTQGDQIGRIAHWPIVYFGSFFKLHN
jgi:hypothetical protein